MNKIYEAAMELAAEQSTVVVRLDMQYNYKEQSHSGYLWLANGHEYKIQSGGYWHKEK